MSTAIQRERYKAILVGSLLLITIIAVVLQKNHLNKVFTIDHNSPFVYWPLDDRSNGGASVATVEVIDDKIVLNCDIIASSYQWPYCEVKFNFVQGKVEGIDLQNYTSVKVWARYSEPIDTGIRFQTLNFDPLYSSLGDDVSLKFNVIEFHEKNTSYPAVLPLSTFQVPTWWLASKEIPLENIGPEFNNTHSIEIATGNSIKPGHYTLVIDKVEFIGKYLSDQNLYLLLLCIWGVAALIYFINSLHQIRVALKQAGQRQQELETLNNFLNVRQQKLEEKLSQDLLTGVMNRAGIIRLFNQKSSSTLKLSIMFIDIDYFKKVNDTYGHNFGDQILIQFAKAIKDNTRELDVLARWGGEEFILACPNTSLTFAAQLAEKLRTHIATLEWPENIRITASFGVAEMRNESPTEFIARADKALYEAKANGRNCVVIAP